MRLLSWVITLPLFFAVIVFVLQNRMQVSLSFWPFDISLMLPVSVLSIGLLCLGFVAGSLVGSLSMLRFVRTSRTLKREVDTLNKKLEQTSNQTVCMPTILVGGRYQTIPPEMQRDVKPGFFGRVFRKGPHK